MKRPALAALAWAWALELGCAPEASSVAFRVIAAPGDDPYRSADAIVVSLERDGADVPGTATRFAPDARVLDLPALPFGQGLAIRVETRSGEIVLARGRSFPFDYPSPGFAPEVQPDVLLGTLSLFSPTVERSLGAPRAVAPTRRGALIATDSALLEYVAHGEDGSARLRTIRPHDPAWTGALWMAVGDRLLAMGAAGSWLVDERGVEIARWDGLRDARAACTLADGTIVALLASGEIVRAELDRAPALDVVASVVATSPQLVTVPVQVGDVDEERVVLVDADRALLVDPRGSLGAAMPELPLWPPRTDRVVAAVGTQELVVAGGRDELGFASRDAILLLVDPDRDRALEPISPPPEALATARAGAAVATLGRGVVLVAGGVGDGGTALRSAELLDYQPLPGVSRATRPLPWDGAPAVATQLGDRTAIVVTPEGVAVYFPPRE